MTWGVFSDEIISQKEEKRNSKDDMRDHSHMVAFLGASGKDQFRENLLKTNVPEIRSTGE